MATIYDVAKLAGVSPKTVSRVINEDPAVRKSTREKVDAAVEQLGYVPSLAARSIRSRRSGLIGLVTGAISHDVTAQGQGGLPDLLIVQGIQSALAMSGHTLLIADTGGDLSRVPDLMRTFEEHRVEGMLFVAKHHSQISLPALRASTKLMLVNCFSDEPIPAILPDDERGQYELVDRMIKAGHRRIGFLTIPSGMEAQGLRLLGYQRALAKHNIEFEPQLVHALELGDVAGQRQMTWNALDNLLNLDQPPTAICCGNDHIAVTVYGVLRSRGVTVPDQISVAGYDNHHLVAETMFPPLTTAELPYRAMGAVAAKQLLAMIDGEIIDPNPEPQLVSGPVCWRESVLKIPTNNIRKFQLKTRSEK